MSSLTPLISQTTTTLTSNVHGFVVTPTLSLGPDTTVSGVETFTVAGSYIVSKTFTFTDTYDKIDVSLSVSSYSALGHPLYQFSIDPDPQTKYSITYTNSVITSNNITVSFTIHTWMNANTCIKLSNLTITGTKNSSSTGIKENSSATNIKLFPNPATNVFTVAGLKTASLNVYNQLGSLVKQQAFANENISLSIADLPQGIYMVEVWADNKRSLSKLIKE